VNFKTAIAFCMLLGLASTNAVSETSDPYPAGPEKPQILKPVEGLLETQTRLDSTASCEALMVVTDIGHPVRSNPDGSLGCPYLERSYSAFPKGINESLTRWGRYSGNLDARGQRLPNATEKANLIRWCYGAGRIIREWKGNAYLGEPSSDGNQCAQETQNYQSKVCYCIR
jgi:hypothetical protein